VRGRHFGAALPTVASRRDPAGDLERRRTAARIARTARDATWSRWPGPTARQRRGR
jgi:hypothetical protein